MCCKNVVRFSDVSLNTVSVFGECCGFIPVNTGACLFFFKYTQYVHVPFTVLAYSINIITRKYEVTRSIFWRLRVLRSYFKKYKQKPGFVFLFVRYVGLYQCHCQPFNM